MAIKRYATSAAKGVIKHGLRTLFYGAVGGTIALVVVFVVYLNSRPDLKVWHTADLDEEFSAESGITSFADYLALEDRLFNQLNDQVYAKLAPEDQRQINRYHRGSLADPARWPKDWNRSYELPVSEPRIGVLLLHGLSDSPYSLRNIGTRLHSEGVYVLGLRVPGHGTAPVGLMDTDWQDMAAAVKLAVHHVRERVGDQPLYIVGYSNGGALAVQYALTTLDDERLPKVQGLLLLSPEIGITKLAALAVWQERLGHLLGMEKLAWNSITLEYDPFKYGSFPLNAGKQAYALTREIQSRITQLSPDGSLERMPPIIGFQSVVDATVTASALVAGLFDRLPGGHHELVLYDINRLADIEPILTSNPTAWIDSMFRGQQHDYVVTLITNKNKHSKQMVARQLKANESTIIDCDLDLEWPKEFYSLSHIALPFPPDDPLYGGQELPGYDGIQLGQLALRGERGVLQISDANLMRLRWNPFYTYQEQRILEFMGFTDTNQHNCWL